MDLEQHGAGQPQHRGVVGEDAHHVGPPLHLLVEPFQRVGAPQLAPVGDREGGEGGQVLAGISQHGGDLGELGLKHGRDLVQLLGDLGAGGLGEDGADGGGDHPGRGLGHPGKHVSEEVDPASKWTRHLCQPAPANTAPMACLRPVWASEMTSCTPASPRALSERRNAVQKAPSSLSPTSGPGSRGHHRRSRRWQSRPRGRRPGHRRGP